MIPRNQQNRKLQIDLSCPTCGMELTDPKTEGFVANNETYCCQGCAEGTGCTCSEVRIARAKAGNKRGDIGQRNPENSPRDKNFNEEINTSGERIGGNKQETRKAPARIQNRGQVDAQGRKLTGGQAKGRDSTREQARGRSEFSGALIKGGTRGVGEDRVSRTGSKGK